MRRFGIITLGTFLMMGQAVSVLCVSLTFDRSLVRPLEYIFVSQALMYMLLRTFKMVCDEEERPRA